MNRTAVFVLRSLFVSPIVLLGAGGGCPGFFPSPGPVVPVDFVDVDLVNEAFDPVDAGLFVDGALFDDVPLEPGEFAELSFDCFAGTTLQTDAILLTPFGDFPSDNAPLVQEGFEFLCGDLVTFIFIDNGIDPFFTRVEVNGVFVTDKPIRPRAATKSE